MEVCICRIISPTLISYYFPRSSWEPGSTFSRLVSSTAEGAGPSRVRLTVFVFVFVVVMLCYACYVMFVVFVFALRMCSIIYRSICHYRKLRIRPISSNLFGQVFHCAPNRTPRK